jgi:hypothetical protein
MPTTTTLHENWQFAQVRDQKAIDWLPVTQVPTSVHVELLKAGKIPDPVSLSASIQIHPHLRIDQFVGLNEWEVQCKSLQVLVTRNGIDFNAQGSESLIGFSGHSSV